MRSILRPHLLIGTHSMANYGRGGAAASAAAAVAVADPRPH